VLRTRLCDLLGIDVPVIQASIGPWTSVELSAAVSNAGGLGSIGTSMQPVERIREHVARMRELTEAPFAVNHTVRPLSEEAFALTLELAPRVVSLALGDPGELVARAHDAGVLFMQQVHSVEQARRVAARGVDVIVAQGSEAGGFGGTVSTMALVPQVVDAVSPTPVVAAGGIADGRGVAAALALGAEGVNIGTRFLAAAETTIPDEWKQAIIAAESQDAVRVEFANDVFPSPGPEGYDTLPRVLRTPFVDEWNGRPEAVRGEAERLRDELVEALREGRAHELVPFTGQTAGMIHEILPVAEILHRLVADAEASLLTAAQARA
jgi:enoyl-[acyl-carrier protein] reductase II